MDDVRGWVRAGGQCGESFADTLAAIDRLPDSLFRPYGMSPQDSAALRKRMHAWAQRIKSAR